MKAKPLPSQDVLNGLFTYSIVTGELRRKNGKIAGWLQIRAIDWLTLIMSLDIKASIGTMAERNLWLKSAKVASGGNGDLIL